MVGAILTQSTSWSNVEKAIQTLKKERLLHPHQISKLRTQKLAGFIRASGYFNQKAKKLKAFVHYFKKNYQGSINEMRKKTLPSLRRELLDIYGIGPETADSMLLYALQKPIFVVDAYTKRIFTRLGILQGGESYEEVQELFMQHLDPDESLFNEYHALIVQHGKGICRKSKPLCGRCPIRSFCHFY